MDDLELKLDELTRNPTPRVPVSLCLDVSGSMDGAPIRELNDALTRFFGELLANKGARYNADISAVTFGETVQQILDFRPVEKQRVPPLRANGPTGNRRIESIEVLCHWRPRQQKPSDDHREKRPLWRQHSAVWSARSAVRRSGVRSVRSGCLAK